MYKTRFAPSPTGDLHLGGVRTALFNWLLARRHGGAFCLRLDDTDTARSTAAAERSILEGLTWLGLTWTGEVVRQSARFDLHREHAARLERAGLAYRSESALWFAMPRDGETVVDDACRGRVTFANATLEDLVILRSDGTPTYNFATVVDDALMGITHIVRGDDLLNSTPKQMQIYRALGFDVPRFAHLPLVLGPDRQRLSKRHGAESVLAYRDRGYVPEALLNAAARLGWSGGGGATQRELFTMGEVAGDFALEALTKSPAVFEPEKLAWMNHEHMRRLPAAELAARVGPLLAARGVRADPRRLAELVELHRKSAKTLVELADQLATFFGGRPALDAKLMADVVAPHVTLLRDLAGRMRAVPDGEFRAPVLDELARTLVRERGMKLGPLAQALRVALTGATVSAAVFDVAAALGPAATFDRLDAALGRVVSAP